MRFVALVSASLMFAGVSAAASQTVLCPRDVRVEATGGLSSGWVATPQVQSSYRTVLQQMGGREVLACIYRFYNGDYTIWREKSADYPNCVQIEGGFFCRP